MDGMDYDFIFEMIRIRKLEVVEYYEKCAICGREIVGRKESQVDYNMRIHMDAKHDNKKKEKRLSLL